MLEINHISRRFGDLQAVADVAFAVAPGEITGFLGPNGAGKTTTMRIIMGITAADSGTVFLNSSALTSSTDRQTFGYMPEERGLYPKMRIQDQLTYIARLHGMERGWAERSAQHWLDRLGLGDRAQSRLGELSHGNQQRVQLAAALVHDPAVLVLDEPFSGLDPVAVTHLSSVIREKAVEGATILFSSHQLELVEDICSSVVLLNRARVVLRGRVDDLRRSAAFRFITVVLDQPAADWAALLDLGDLVDKSATRVRLRVPAETDPTTVLRRATRLGDVLEFCSGPPTLSDLFVEAVSQ